MDCLLLSVFMWLCVLIVILKVSVQIFHIIIRNTREGKLFDAIPGPKGYTFIGNALDYNVNQVELFYKGRSNANEFPSLYRVWIINRRVLNLYDPDDIEVIMSNSKILDKGFTYSFMRPWLNEGLLLSTGVKWQTRRKILTPAFHFNILREFCDIFEENSDRLVQELQGEQVSSARSLLPIISMSTLVTLCETAMGTQLDSKSERAIRYKKAIYQIGEYVIQRLVKYWLHTDLIFNLSTYGRKQKTILKDLHNFTTSVIDRRRNSSNGKSFSRSINESENDSVYSKGKKRLAMLDLLLESEKEGKIDAEGIREEVDTFMFEGHDTTTMALCFCLMMLANHQKIQEKVVEEIERIFCGSRRRASMEDLIEMRYLDCCIKETLRLYPSVPFISRFIHEDIQIKNYTVPAMTQCHIHIYDMHRQASLYPDPFAFDPDRFLPTKAAGRHPFAYIPFSAGPRNCIGQRFALLQQKSIISSLLRTFKLEAVTKPEDVVFYADLVLRPRDPIVVKFVPRNGLAPNNKSHDLITRMDMTASL